MVGVTTAYQLQKDGHDVVVLERNGLRSPPRYELGQRRHDRAGPFVRLVIAQGADDFVEVAISWEPSAALQILRRSQTLLLVVGFPEECTPEKARRNTLLKHRLAAYSQRVLNEVVAEEAIEYHRSQRGILYFHRDRRGARPGRRAYEAARVRWPGDQGPRPRGRHRARTVACGGKDEDCRRDLLSDRRDRRIPPNLRARWRPRLSRGAGEIRTGVDHHRARRLDGDRIDAALTDKGRLQGRRLCARARRRKSDFCAKTRTRSADLSDQGLFADHSDRQPADRRRPSPPSTSTTSSLSRASAIASASRRPPNSPATTPATSPPISPS